VISADHDRVHVVSHSGKVRMVFRSNDSRFPSPQDRLTVTKEPPEGPPRQAELPPIRFPQSPRQRSDHRQDQFESCHLIKSASTAWKSQKGRRMKELASINNDVWAEVFAGTSSRLAERRDADMKAVPPWIRID